MRALLLIACLTAGAAQAAQSASLSPAEATLAWLRDDVVSARIEPAASAAPANAPLGSLWKLYVYAYLVETGAREPAFQCDASAPGHIEAQEYCCKPGESVRRDPALARSCSAYFEPQRLGITSGAWRSFWRARWPGAADWLANLSALRPQTQVSLVSLLESLRVFPEQARHAAREALAEVCRRYGVRELSLFGSAARGEMRPGSDLDMMVEFEHGARVGLIRFESFVEELESLTGQPVDLVTKRGLKPWVRPNVLKDALLIYAA